MEKPLILVCNDDGIIAPGIRELIYLMSKLGDVYVVAPDSPQSGMGHAVTISSTLRVEELVVDGKAVREWSCSGTPADCVKLAKHELLPRTPDLCVSGINHGSNSSINVIYSGTMSAALEAAMEGIPAIGFSLCDYRHNADFSAAGGYITDIARDVLENGLPQGIALNVNIPAVSKEKIKGVKICRQANAVWEEKFDKRTDPRGRTYYWLTGDFVNQDNGKDTDEWALAHDYISIVPVKYDLTSYKDLEDLKNHTFEKMISKNNDRVVL